MPNAHFLPLEKCRSVCTGDCQATDRKPNETNLQNNRPVFLLHDFQFAEFHRDDAIGPMTEGILQHTLSRLMRTESQRQNERRVLLYQRASESAALQAGVGVASVLSPSSLRGTKALSHEASTKLKP
jgi:hypothetical protein